jgi:hypothetical protein
MASVLRTVLVLATIIASIPTVAIVSGGARPELSKTAVLLGVVIALGSLILAALTVAAWVAPGLGS